MEKTDGPDQLASSEASWSGSSVFSKDVKILHRYAYSDQVKLKTVTVTIFII